MLIIVESPAKAKTIAKIVGKKYIVKASVGHIRQISDSSKTKEGKKLEINGIDIDNHFQPIFEVDEKKKKVVSELKKLVKEQKGEILFATDEDREGEAISWHLAQVLKIPETQVKRLVFHEITKSAIEKALRSPRNLDLNLVWAQKARQVLDKLVGYKLSPVLWKVMNNYYLSAGRVQSPALKLVCDRENEILTFLPEKYFEVFGTFQIKPAKTILSQYLYEQKPELKETLENFQTLELKKYHNQKLDSVKNIEITQVVNEIAKDPKFTVQNLETREEKHYPKPPFITSTLQQTASSLLKMSPKQTMSLAQKLYEGVNIDGHPQALITYMRTDSTNLSTEFLEKTRKFISQKFVNFLPEKPIYYKSKSKNAQEAHEAIRPVDVSVTPESLKGKLEPAMLKLYELIWRRAVSSQMTPELKKRFSYSLVNKLQDEFSGSVSVNTELGFKSIWNYGITKDDSRLFNLVQNFFTQNSEFYLENLFSIENFTQPPSRYSPASLIKKLEDLGIGRPSTYASIISTLSDRNYAEITKNVIYPTTLGMNVCRLLVDNFAKVTSSSLTSEMEEGLDAVSRGEKEYEKLLRDFWWEFKKEVETVAPTLTTKKSEYNSSLTEVKDPKYGDLMVLKTGRFGEYYQNPNHPEVMYPKNFQEVSIAKEDAMYKFGDQVKGKKCEICGKDLEIRISNKTLSPYIACPEYRVGNKHTVVSIDYGPCPKCAKEGRNGHLHLRSSRGRQYLTCELDRKVCDYTQNLTEKKKIE